MNHDDSLSFALIARLAERFLTCCVLITPPHPVLHMPPVATAWAPCLGGWDCVLMDKVNPIRVNQSTQIVFILGVKNDGMF